MKKRKWTMNMTWQRFMNLTKIVNDLILYMLNICFVPVNYVMHICISYHWEIKVTIIIIITCTTSHVAGQPLQMSQTLGSKLVQDSGQHLSNFWRIKYIFNRCSLFKCSNLNDQQSVTTIKMMTQINTLIDQLLLLTFIFCVSGDSECVGGERSLYLGIVEMDHRTIIFDHVHFFNAGDVVDWKWKYLTFCGEGVGLANLIIF